MIESTLDLKPLSRALAAVPDALARHLGTGLAGFGFNWSDDFATHALGVPDDRNPADWLQRRPTSSDGLVNRSGGMARGLVAKSAKASKLSDVELRIGWSTVLQARIARVHELGTVRYGGSMPDIVPVRARKLRIPIRGLQAALSNQVDRTVLLDKVGIPPRLGFRKYWNRKSTADRLAKVLAKAGAAAMAEAAARGGRSV